MDLDQMRYFIAVAECRSVTKAAQHFYISQPSLSRCIAAVEEEAGTLLLDRTSRPLSLTFAGQQYYATAKKMLELNDDLNRQLKDITVEPGQTVESGTILGYVSDPTKYYVKEGANLYFSMTKDGNPIDPMIYIETVTE